MEEEAELLGVVRASRTDPEPHHGNIPAGGTSCPHCQPYCRWHRAAASRDPWSWGAALPPQGSAGPQGTTQPIKEGREMCIKSRLCLSGLLCPVGLAHG